MTSKNQRMITFSELSLKMMEKLKDLGLGKTYSQIIDKCITFFYNNQINELQTIYDNLKSLSIEDLEKQLEGLKS